VTSEPLKNDKPGQQILIKLSLEQDAKSIDGEDVHPGFTLYHRITLFNSDVTEDKQKQSREISLQALARFQEGVLGKKGAWSPSDYIGKPAIAKVAVRPARDQFEESNDVKGYVKVQA